MKSMALYVVALSQSTGGWTLLFVFQGQKSDYDKKKKTKSHTKDQTMAPQGRVTEHLQSQGIR